MSADAWFIHVQDETLGPLSTEKVLAMLGQNRFQFADFAWCAGLTKWVRLSDIDGFAAQLPPYPKAPIPEATKKKTKSVAPEPAAAPAPQVKTRFLRIPCTGKIISTEHGSFNILNVAERGLFVSSEAPPPVGTEIKFKIESKSFAKTLEMTGVVIRHANKEEDPGFAVEFTRVNPAHKRIFEEYVRSWLEK